MHLDTDVLPGQLIAAPLLAQYPESHSPGCEPQIIEGALTQEGLELPAEWQVVALGVHPTGRAKSTAESSAEPTQLSSSATRGSP